MTAHDICADIAALLHPVPAPASGEHEDDWAPPAEVWEEREEEARQLRLSWEEGGTDPLLATLASLRAQRLRLEADMRLLIAYARRFTHPRPYKLIDLAEAAGMSISGVRIAYDDEELNQLIEMLGRAPVALPDGADAPER
jgi:hypothetical protein